MQCPRCEQENSLGARFCSSCGADLGLTGRSCRHRNPAGSRFCNCRGASLEATPTPVGPTLLAGVIHSQEPRRENPHHPAPGVD